jgi:hypothetical protein
MPPTDEQECQEVEKTQKALEDPKSSKAFSLHIEMDKTKRVMLRHPTKLRLYLALRFFCFRAESNPTYTKRQPLGGVDLTRSKQSSS